MGSASPSARSLPTPSHCEDRARTRREHAGGGIRAAAFFGRNRQAGPENPRVFKRVYLKGHNIWKVIEHRSQTTRICDAWRQTTGPRNHVAPIPSGLPVPRQGRFGLAVTRRLLKRRPRRFTDEIGGSLRTPVDPSQQLIARKSVKYEHIHTIPEERRSLPLQINRQYMAGTLSCNIAPVAFQMTQPPYWPTASASSRGPSDGLCLGQTTIRE